MRDAMRMQRAEQVFIGAWLLLCMLKLVLAARLPLFVDEAFYWQEGRHLAWAYSDLPGLTAWLARLGVAMGGDHPLALRLPFLLLGAWVPWLVVRMTAREFDVEAGWHAGLLALLLPLAGTAGVLALPDVPLLLASALCLDAGLRALRRVDGWVAGELATGLVLGGLAHYRFAVVIVVGVLALLALREGRRALRAPWLWLAISVGALAWLPLLWWNLQHADAGLRFQLIDRHPWQFSGVGLRLGLLQWGLVTPLLFLALALAAWRGLRDARPAARWLALCGSAIVLGFFVLGFFADRQRVSFHWPLPGFLALLPLAPGVLGGQRGWRWAVQASTAAGLLLALGYLLLAAQPAWRQRLAGSALYPGNFAGWGMLGDAVTQRLLRMPAHTQLVAGDFKIGAELGFVLGQPDVPVLEHPLNARHGRAVQLQAWGLVRSDRAALGRGPLLLVASPSHAGFAGPQAYRRQLRAQLGTLPPPQRLQVDGGGKVFLLYAIPAQSLP